MAREHGVDRQAQLIRLILVILGAVLALIGWAVQAVRLPGRGLGALTAHRQSDRTDHFPSKET